MYQHDKERECEHLLGVQEAANYLGIHRATLFRALGSGLIIPDQKTPKGRARFRMETVRAFQVKLKSQAATGQDHLYGPVRILAKLANLLAMPSPPADTRAVLDDTLQLLCSSYGASDEPFDKAFVALLDPSETDSYAVRLLAKRGIPEGLRMAYRCLRPCEEFPLNLVLRTGGPEFCEDIRQHSFPNATALRVLGQNGIISYAVVPIVTGTGVTKETYGALVVCGRAAHKFSQQERVFLGGVADALSACIIHSGLLLSEPQAKAPSMLTPETALDVAATLLETAYARAWRADALPSSVVPVESLCDLLVTRSHALTTWVDGFPPRACGDKATTVREDDVIRRYRSNLASLVRQTRAADGLKREQWHSRETHSTVTAVALPVPLPSGARGAVGAVWPGVREEVAAEGIVLSTLASACSLVTQYSPGEGH